MSQSTDAPMIDTTAFSAGEYRSMLDEIRSYLPAFLAASAVEQHDPAGDVRELLALAAHDLERVRAVHVCLDERVRAFIDALPRGIRRPITSTLRPREVTQAVRGPIDWGATVRVRSLAGNDPSMFVIRPAQRVFDTPENRALAWSLRRLDAEARIGLRTVSEVASDDEEAAGWLGQLHRIRSATRRALRVEWLREIAPERPTTRDRQRLAASRIAFYKHDVAGAVRTLVAADRNDEQSITDMLCQRYFRPKEAWRLFEVTVALSSPANSPSPSTPTASAAHGCSQGRVAFPPSPPTGSTTVTSYI